MHFPSSWGGGYFFQNQGFLRSAALERPRCGLGRRVPAARQPGRWKPGEHRGLSPGAFSGGERATRRARATAESAAPALRAGPRGRGEGGGGAPPAATASPRGFCAARKDPSAALTGLGLVSAPSAAECLLLASNQAQDQGCQLRAGCCEPGTLRMMGADWTFT